MKSAISLTFIARMLVSAPLASAAEEHGHFFFFVAPGDVTSDRVPSSPELSFQRTRPWYMSAAGVKGCSAMPGESGRTSVASLAQEA